MYLNQASGREDLAQSTLSSSPQTLKSRTVKTLRGSTMTSSQVGGGGDVTDQIRLLLGCVCVVSLRLQGVSGRL